MRKTLGIVDFSVKFRVTITMFILIVMVFGLISLRSLGLDMLPDISFPMVTVVTQYPGVAPEEIEQLVTKPLEGMIAAVNGVKKLSSQSVEGVSAITVEFEWGTNLDYAAQDIKDNIGFVRDFLPEGISEPSVFKFDIAQMPVMFMGVSGMENTYELRRTLTENVTERLQRLDGVAQASVFGGERRQITVGVDAAKMATRGLTIDQITSMLPAQNLNLPAGYHVERGTDFLIRSVGEFRSIEDIRDAIVGLSPDGTAIRLRDVATVENAFKERRSRSLMDGKESVFLIISKRSGANTLQVSRRVQKEMEHIKKVYPKLTFISIFDQGRPVEMVTTSTSTNAAIGGLLAVAFMWIFLLNIRPTLVIGVAIPLSIVATFIPLYMAGFTLNLMTLGGLALGVGMLVDNAIVVIENIYRHLEHGADRNEAARVGASEVTTAITASTFTTIVVFLPILFSKGITSQLTRGLSLTIIFSLLASLTVALTMVPMLASVFFKRHRVEESSRWFKPIRQRYGASLSWVLANPWKTALLVISLVVISIGAAVKFLGTEFMPEADNNMFILAIELPVGTPLEESAVVSGQIRELIQSYPEIETVGEMVGRDDSDRGADQASITGPNSIQMFVKTVEAKDRKRKVMEVQNDIRARLPKLANTRITFQNMGMMGQGAKAVKVNVYGNDLETLEEICENVRQVMVSVDGLKDVESSFSKGRPEYHFRVDRQKALMYGLAPVQIQRTLESANLGRVATRLRTGDEEIDVRVILDKKYRDNLDLIRTMPLKTPSGALVPLGQVVEISREMGPTVINRDNKYRVGTVDANLTGRSLGRVVAELKGKLAHVERALPDGYSLSFKGQFEDMQESFKDLALGLLLAILLVYMVMASQFESLVHPFVILFSFPLAIVGVAWILILTGSTFSVVSFVGVIILAGIVVNNGIVLIDYVNQLRHEGMEIREALVTGGKTRIRPILITAGTTIMGMLPMALSRSEGSQMSSPMAWTVIGGLTSSTLLTLYVVPIVYIVLDRSGTWIKGRFKNMIHREPA